MFAAALCALPMWSGWDRTEPSPFVPAVDDGSVLDSDEEVAFQFVALYGAADEIHQRFVPNRSCDVLDWLADTLGASLVFLTCLPRPKAGKGNHSP